MHFRKEQIAVTADVEQMFYCFMVREDHQNFLRFLWFKDNDLSKKITRVLNDSTCFVSSCDNFWDKTS